VIRKSILPKDMPISAVKDRLIYENCMLKAMSEKRDELNNYVRKFKLSKITPMKKTILFYLRKDIRVQQAKCHRIERYAGEHLSFLKKMNKHNKDDDYRNYIRIKIMKNTKTKYKKELCDFFDIIFMMPQDTWSPNRSIIFGTTVTYEIVPLLMAENTNYTSGLRIGPEKEEKALVNEMNIYKKREIPSDGLKFNLYTEIYQISDWAQKIAPKIDIPESRENIGYSHGVIFTIKTSHWSDFKILSNRIKKYGRDE